MKRLLVCILVLALCLSGCQKKRTDLPGSEEVPEGIDWKLWEQYTPATLTMGEETVDVLITMDAVHMAIYYDRDEQELMGSLTIMTPLSDLSYSRERMQIKDKNADGYDDICVPDMLDNGDRIISWWLWDREAESYVYAPELCENQTDIAADVTWKAGQEFSFGNMDTPKGPQDLLVRIEGQDIFVYLDTREEQLWGTARIPEPLTVAAPVYWELRDLNGDGWGDLRLPYRWDTAEDGSLFQYSYCWLWDNGEKAFVYDAEASENPVI